MIRFNVGISTNHHFRRSPSVTKLNRTSPIKQPHQFFQVPRPCQSLQILRNDKPLRSTLGSALDDTIDQLEAYSQNIHLLYYKNSVHPQWNQYLWPPPWPDPIQFNCNPHPFHRGRRFPFSYQTITETNMAKKKDSKSTKKARLAAMRQLPMLSEKMKQFPDLCAEMDLSSSDDEDSVTRKNNTAAIAPPLSPMKKPQSTKRQARSSPTRQPADEDNNTNLSSTDDSL